MSQTFNDIAAIQTADNVYIDIDSGTSTNYYEASLRFRHGSVTRFAIEKDNVANADLYIRRYNSSGVLQDSPILIEGDDGAITFAPTGEINFNASQVWTLAAADTISVDAGTTDHTGSTVFTTNLDVNSANCTLFHATIDIGTLLSAGEIVKGTYYDITEAVVNADTSGIIGYDLAITGFSTSRNDITGYKCLVDGTKDGADITKFFLADCDATINTNTVYGTHIDFSGATQTNGTVYGSYIDVSQTVTAGTSTAEYIKLSAAATGIQIDAGTIDHTGANIITADVDVNSANCNFINATIDIGTLLSAGEIAKGCYFDITEAVVNADTSQIIAYDTAMTGFATGRADLIAYKALIDGSKTGGDTETGLLVDVNATINHSGESLKGYWFDGTGMTLTDGSVYGAYIDMTFTNGSTAYGVYILNSAATTAAIGIDCGTTDSTGGTAITVDFDVNSASADCINLNVDVGTALSAAEIVNGISIDIDGNGGDDAGSYMNGIYLTSANTTTGINNGIQIDGAWDICLSVGTAASALAFTASTQRGYYSNITSNVTSGNIVSMQVSQALTGASATNTTELAQFVLTSDVQVGNWANAVLGKIDFSTNGYVTGLAGVFCAELDLPGSSTGGAGTYSCFEAEINCPTSYEGNSPIHVFQINAWGAAVTEFDDNGYLFDITGVSSGATGIWYDNQKAAPAVEEFIRVKTPSGVRYLALYDANA